jgi:signal transduction histidine kinase/ActR/RegA family two-component response regulator
MEVLRKLFSAGEFLPHATCYLWTPGLLWLHALSDTVITLAYFSIPFSLLYVVRRRKDLPFHSVLLSFGLFIVACGMTHGMEVWTLFHATYWLSGVIKAMTAIVSVATAVLLVRIRPHVLALPSPAMMRLANAQLENEVEERKRAETALNRANEALDERVRARTTELAEVNSRLQTQIEERERAEEGLRQSQKMESVGRLAGGIAHDFNNILTVVLGYCDILRTGPRAEDTEASIAQIHTAAERAASLTGQLLAFSRRQVLEPKVLDLSYVVRGMETMLRRLIGEDLRVVTRLRDPLWSVRADPGQIEQAILNLVVNARDAMPGGGALIIATDNVELDERFVREHPGAKTGRYAVLAVTDTGTGIAADVKARLFEPFFTTKGVGKGTGLGLSTIYGFVKQSNGYISCESELQRGATFRIYLPQVDAEVEYAGPATRAAATGGSEVVLLVEDEDGVRTLVRRILTAKGYRVVDASNSAEALRLADKLPDSIDLVITDMVMPGGSGRELAKELALRRPEIRVLFVSGYTDDAITGLGVLPAGAAFLHKPFKPDLLLAKVREVLDSRPRSSPPRPSAH